MRETSSQTKHTVILEVTEFHKKDQAEIPRDKIADWPRSFYGLNV